MKKALIIFLSAVMVLGSCAKKATPGPNDLSRESLIAWMNKHYPDARPSGHGVYIIENNTGGTVLGDEKEYPYISVDYVYYNLYGDILGYTEEPVAKQLGEYSETANYTPEIFYRGENGMNMGLRDAVSGMSVGGERLVVIPGWLNSSAVYDTEAEYLANVTGKDGIYRLKLREQIKDIDKWELDSLYRYVNRNYGLAPKDTLKKGFFYVRTGEPESTKEFPKDTTIKINYIGRLLNGKVFDTTIKDTAIFYGIYNSSSTYQATSVKMAENYSEITLGESTVIDGFAYTISKMHPGESGSGIFYSVLGYGTSGSGNSIPAYSPLRFDISVVSE